MGIAASAMERAALQSLLQLARKTKTELGEGDLAALLLFCRRRGLLTATDQLYDLQFRAEIVQELWEEVTVGNKEVKKLSPTWRSVKLMLETFEGEVKVSAAARRVIEKAEHSDNCVTFPDPVVSCPESKEEKEFWGGVDTSLPPWTPPEQSPPSPMQTSSPLSDSAATPSAPSAPQNACVDPSKIPLPPESEGMEVDEAGTLYPSVCNQELRRALREQSQKMTELLNQMERLDKDSGKKKIERRMLMLTKQ